MWIAIHLNMRVPCLMALEVDLQVSFSRETIATDVAFEWSLSSMRSDVNLEGAVTSKYLMTESAFVTEERIICCKLGIKNGYIWWFAFALQS